MKASPKYCIIISRQSWKFFYYPVFSILVRKSLRYSNARLPITEALNAGEVKFLELLTVDCVTKCYKLFVTSYSPTSLQQFVDNGDGFCERDIRPFQTQRRIAELFI